MMKAVIYKKYGPPSVLHLTELPIPSFSDSELLIKIEATTVTSGDVRMRSSDFPPLYYVPGRLALGLLKPKKQILGHEFAGTVLACGNDVRRFKAGDRVYGTTSGLKAGSHAEYIVVPERKRTCVLGKIPENISFPQAAAVPIGGMTALDLLLKGGIKDAGGRKAAEGRKDAKSVLVIGACGSVGSFALQISKIFGASVTAVCSSGKVETARELGAAQVIDYSRESLASSGAKYDLVFDSTGKYKKSNLSALLSENGRFVSTKSLTAEKTDYLCQLTEWLEQKKIKPLIDCSFDFNQIAQAHEYVEKGHKSGAVIITASTRE